MSETFVCLYQIYIYIYSQVFLFVILQVLLVISLAWYLLRSVVTRMSDDSRLVGGTRYFVDL